MPPRFATFAFAAFVVGILPLFGWSFAVAESAAPKAANAPQQKTTKPPLAKSDGAAFDAMRAHVMTYWLPPFDRTNPDELVIKVRLNLKPDGTLADAPRVMTAGTTERFLKAREAAVRAIFRAMPLTMLLPVNYERWKQIEITFDPRQPTPR